MISALVISISGAWTRNVSLPFDAGRRRQIGQLLERLQKRRPAIGVAAVIDRIRADEEVERPDGLGVSEARARAGPCCGPERT